MHHTFTWKMKGNTFIASVTGGRAVIVEGRQTGYGVPIGGGWTYDARLEFNDGTTFEKSPTWRLFEEAEKWCQVRLSDFYQIQYRGREEEQDPLLQAIIACEELLGSKLPPIYLERLAAIRGWFDPSQQSRGLVLEEPSSEMTDWNQTDEGWTAKTDHGQALVWETKLPIGDKVIGWHPRYGAQITHPSGVILKTAEYFLDEEQAKEWINEALRRLDDPRVEEHLLDVLEFTLSVCQALIASEVETEIVHFLEDVKVRLSERLL